jgi:hypothetical protein
MFSISRKNKINSKEIHLDYAQYSYDLDIGLLSGIRTPLE